MIFGNLKRLICAAALTVGAPNLHGGYTAGETLWQTNFPTPRVFRMETHGNDKVTLRPGVKLSGVVWVDAVVKGKDVTRGPNGWNGPKVMFPYRKADGTADNPQLRGVYGTYDWQTWTRVMSFPGKGVDAAIVLGLEECTGEFQIRSIKVSRAVETDEETMEPVPVDPTLPRGKFLGTRNPDALRGVMSGGDMGEAAVDELAAWGVKLVRLQISGLKDAGTPEGYRQALALRLEERKQVADRLWKRGIRTVLDLHQGPGCAQNKILQNRLSADYDPADLCRAWVQIATVFKGHPGVWAYDILNEPICPEATWKRICRDVMAAVRTVDAETPFVMSIPDTRAFDYYVPNEKVVYSPHFYSPHALTHQGVINEGKGMLRWSYPGVVDGERWDRETIRRHLRPVIEFQLRHPDVRIYVGEFSCIPWVKGDAEYVRDCISVFDEYGWDWTYHAYREWPGWDVDYDAVKDYEKKLYKPSRPSSRKRVLLEALKSGLSTASGHGALAANWIGADGKPACKYVEVK